MTRLRLFLAAAMAAALVGCTASPVLPPLESRPVLDGTSPGDGGLGSGNGG